MLHVLGAAAARYNAPATRLLREVACAMYGQGDTALWFSGNALTGAGAVFCNSAAVSALDLDDGNRAAQGHHGEEAICAALDCAAEGEAKAQMTEAVEAEKPAARATPVCVNSMPIFNRVSVPSLHDMKGRSARSRIRNSLRRAGACAMGRQAQGALVGQYFRFHLRVLVRGINQRNPQFAAGDPTHHPYVLG